MAEKQKDPNEVYGAKTIYRELAYYISRREEYERALKYFDEAIKKNPNDKRSLMGRCWARSKVCKYQGALEDIAKFLKQDPENLVMIAHKALNTYLCCEFENALILNMKMVPIRKKPDNFTMGVMHCYEAIENCVGIRAGHPLRDHYKIVRRLGWKKAREAEKPFVLKARNKKKRKAKKQGKTAIFDRITPTAKQKLLKSTASRRVVPLSGDGKTKDGLLAISGSGAAVDNQELTINESLHTLKTESDYVPPGKPFPYRPVQRYTTNIENYMAEKYLDSMYLDKIFLKKLRFNTGITSPNKSGVEQIVAMSKEGYNTLSYKQELLRTRRPFYFIKYQEAKLSGALRDRIAAELRKMQEAAAKDADGLVQKIKTALQEKQTRVALETVEKLKQFCDTKAKKVLPMREEYLEEMYELCSQAYYQMFRLNKKQFEWDQIRRIQNWLGLPNSREPSTDSIINQFKGIFVDWKKQIIIFEDRLQKATTFEEMAWIYHELSRCHVEIKQYELARVYARKCISESRKVNHIIWTVNAMMLIFRINILLHNRNDARNQLYEVSSLAKQLSDTTLEEYVQKCLQLVDTIGNDESMAAKVLEKREKQIIDMMSGAGLQSEVAHLFRKMGALPAARRMSVMPGVRLEDTSGKAAAATRKMSISPGQKQSEDHMAAKRVGVPAAKKVEDDSGAKGIQFMELIKYHVD